jgi:hypothetical protein
LRHLIDYIYRKHLKLGQEARSITFDLARLSAMISC